jgi:hypothetical protein
MEFMNRKYIIFIVFALLLSAYSIYISNEFLLQEQVIFSKLNVKSNRDIIIWVDTFDDNCLGYYYESRNNKVTTPKKFIGCNRIEAHFSLLISKDQNIVGIVEGEKPELVLAVHDFESGETCLREKADDRWEVVIEKRRCLLDRLKEANPQRKLFFRDNF